jgi:hypothetical protein
MCCVIWYYANRFSFQRTEKKIQDNGDVFLWEKAVPEKEN